MTYHHLSVLVHKQAKKYGDRTALQYRDYSKGKWIPISWNEFSTKVKIVANALQELSISEQENIGVFSQNKPEGLFVDFGAFANRGVTVPLYATSSPSQASYILKDAGIRFLFVGEQYQYDIAASIFDKVPTLEKIIIFDTAVQRKAEDKTSIYFDDFLALGSTCSHQETVDEITEKASEDDLANILYTSGTTGEPKGVMLHHSNYLQAVQNHFEILESFSDKDTVLSFLPMTHIFERAWVYLCLSKGAMVYISLKPIDVLMALKEVRPSLLCSVPRFWEKVYTGVQEKIDGSSFLLRKLMLRALKVGKRYNVDHVRIGKKPSLGLKLRYLFYDKTIFSLLKRTIGVENGNFFPTGGAAIPQKVFEFCRSVGINILAGYGLTESTASVSNSNLTNYRFDSVGRIQPNVQVKIGKNNEILLKGKTITKGYYNRPDVNAQAFDEDGWFHTGDAGYIENGELFLTERLKDLYKTSNGKYVAPQALESTLCVSRFIDQIVIIADKRKFVSALIVPDFNFMERCAHEKGIAYESIEELLEKEIVIETIKADIDELQMDFANYEKVKKFRLLTQPFSLEKGEVTNTMKVKRSVVFKNYATLIDTMYEE